MVDDLKEVSFVMPFSFTTERKEWRALKERAIDPSHSMQARKGPDLLSGHGVSSLLWLWRHFPIPTGAWVEGSFSSSPFSVERRRTLKAFFSALRKLSVKAVLGLQKEVCSLLEWRIDYLTYFGLQTLFHCPGRTTFFNEKGAGKTKPRHLHSQKRPQLRGLSSDRRKEQRRAKRSIYDTIFFERAGFGKGYQLLSLSGKKEAA